MNRVDRLHAILVHLQSKKRVTAQEIADRFELSLRTVYRDIKALEEGGVPIIGEAGIGYSVMEGYRLPPILFTKEEASSLLLGAKFVQRFTDNSDQKYFAAAMFKVKAVLRSSDKEFVEELDSRIAIQSGPLPLGNEAELHLSTLRQSLVDKRVIRIRYYSAYKEEITERDVEPIGLLYYGQSWHAIGWCRLRRDYRDFRLDRVEQISLQDERFEDKPHPTLKEYMEKEKTEEELLEVIVSFDKNLARHIQTQKYFYGFDSQEEKEGRLYMRFLTACPDYFCRWLLSFTTLVQIETPEAVAPIMEKLLAELREHYPRKSVLSV